MYKRRDSLSILFDLKLRFIDDILKEIESEIRTTRRYPKESIMRDKGYVLVDVEVFKDYLFYRKLLKSEAGRKKVPPFKDNQYKYLDAVLIFFGFEPMGLELPTGISFYIFQAVSYVCDVRRRAARVQRDPLLFTTYVSLFPQLVAGPIVRYTEIEAELTDRKHSVSSVAEGLRLFSVGLAKKMLLANGAGECWERMARYSIHGGTTLGAWLGLSLCEWAVIILCIALVMSLECANTAIEASVDLASLDIHPLAKKAKDCAAGAVLLAT